MVKLEAFNELCSDILKSTLYLHNNIVLEQIQNSWMSKVVTVLKTSESSSTFNKTHKNQKGNRNLCDDRS